MPKPWQDISLQIGTQNVTLGQTVNVNGILQDSYTSEFLVRVEGVISTVAATPAIEGLPSLVSNMTIQGPLAGFAPLAPINGLSGPMISEFSQFKRSNVSYSWGALGTTGKFGVTLPLTFINPRMRYPLSHMSLLPTKLMGSINFTIKMANQNQIDTNATPTFATSTLTVSVQQNEYKSSSIPAMAPLAATVAQGAWMFIPSQLNYFSQQNIQASAAFQQLIPNGTTTLVLIRSFPTCTTGGTPTARQSDTVVGGPLDLSVTSAGIVLMDVNQAPRVSTTFYMMRKQNLDNITDSLVAGNAAFMFNQGIDKIFQPSVGPNQIPINYATTLTGTTNPRVDFVYEQITDTQNWLGLA